MDNLPVQGVESHGLLEGGSMGRILALLYGVVCYFVFFGTFLYLVWFVWSMSPTRPEAPLDRALLIDGGLVLLFAVQHSRGAHKGRKGPQRHVHIGRFARPRVNVQAGLGEVPVEPGVNYQLTESRRTRRRMVRRSQLRRR